MTSKRARRLLAALVAAAHLFSCAAPALANPEGGAVVHGSATIEARPGVTTIHQHTDRAIINWQSFSNSAGEAIHFQQPAATSVTLNRVVGVDPSLIQGSLSSNGRLFLINPNGIVFGENARIDVGGIVASTLSISDDDFKNGNYTLVQNPGKALAAVINKGTITAKPGGFVALVAPIVNNQGKIVAAVGRVTLAAGTKAVINPDGHGLVNLQVDGAPHGDVSLREEDASSLMKQAVNNKHIISSGKVEVSNGRVFLTGASGLAINEGEVRADGAAGGLARVESTQATILAPGSAVSANATAAGAKGGDVRALSAGATGFMKGARLEAKGGGGASGDGGFVEVSGTGKVAVHGQVDVTAPDGGMGGTFLIDPNRIVIVPGPGNGDGDLPEILFSENVGFDSFIDEALIEGAAAGTNIVLEADDEILATELSDNKLVIPTGGSLTLRTKTGSVFLGSKTLQTQGTGSILIQAGINNGATPAVELGNVMTATGSVVIECGTTGGGPGGQVRVFGTISTSGGVVEIDAGNITLGTISTGTGGPVILNATGVISDGNGTAANIITSGINVLLNAGNNIGNGAGDPLEIQADSFEANSTNGGIWLRSPSSGMLVRRAFAPGGDVLLAADAGNVDVFDALVRGSGLVNLQAPMGSITMTAGSDPLQATNVEVLARDGIGVGTPVKIAATSVKATTTELNKAINITATSALTNIDVAHKAGSYSLAPISISGGTNNFSTDATGVINYNGPGSTFRYRNSAGGPDPLKVGTITATNVTIESGGTDIVDNNGASPNVTATNATFIGGGGFMGTSGDPLDIALSGVLNVTAGGDAYFDGSIGSTGTIMVVGTLGGNAVTPTDLVITVAQLEALAAGTTKLYEATNSITIEDAGDNQILLALNTSVTFRTVTGGIAMNTGDTLRAQGSGTIFVNAADRTAGGGFATLGVLMADAGAITVKVGRNQSASGGTLAYQGITTNGNVTVQAGSIPVKPITGLNVALDASGAVTDANAAGDDIYHLTGGSLNITANGAVGTSGDLIDTRADTINVMAGGGVFLNEVDQIPLLDVTAGGDVTVMASGNVGLGKISAPGRLVTLVNGAGTLFDSGPADTDLIATSAVLDVGTMVTGGQAIETTVTNLDVRSRNANGVVAINETDTLASLIVRTDIASYGTGTVQITGTSSVAIDANGVMTGNLSGGDLTYTNDGAAVLKLGGLTGDEVTFDVAGLDDGAASGADLTARIATLNTRAGSVATMADPLDTSISETLNGLVVGGGIHLFNGATLRLGALTASTAGGDVNVTVGSGNITVDVVTAADELRLTALAGAILDVGPAGTDLIAPKLFLAASGDIGETANSFHTRADQLTASSTNGFVFLKDEDALTIESATANGAGGDVRIHTFTGDLTVKSVSANDQVDLIAELGSVLDGDAGTARNVAAGGILKLQAAGTIGLSGNALDTEAGTIRASTTSGGIFLHEESTVTVGTSAANGMGTAVFELVSDAGDIAIIETGITAGLAVYLTANGGKITDPGGANGQDIGAWDTYLTARDGIGLSGNPLDIAVNGAVAAVTGENASIYLSDPDGIAVWNLTANIADYGMGTVQATGPDSVTITGDVLATTGAGTYTYVNSSATAPVLKIGSLAGNTLDLTSPAGFADANTGLQAGTVGTLTLRSATGSIGASGNPIEVRATSLTALVSAAGSVFLDEADGATLATITAAGAGADASVSSAAGNLVVNTVTAPDQVILAANGGAITDGNAGAANLTGASVNLSARDAIATNVDPLETQTGTLTASTSGTVGASAINVANTGALNVSSINAGGTGSNVQLEVLGGSLTVGTISAAGDLVEVVVSAGGIVDGNAGAANVTAGQLILTARDAIATNVDPLETAAGTLTASTSGTMGASAINLANTGALSVTSINAGGTGSNVQLEVLGGSLTVGTISAAGDLVEVVVSAGGIADGNAGAANVTAGQLILTARDAIATNVDPLETAAGTLTASTSGTVGASAINVANTGALNVTSISAGGTGSNVQLEVLGGSLSVGTISAAGDLVEVVVSAGGIVDGNAGAANLTAGQLILTARDAIATSLDPLDTAAGSITASTMGTMGASSINLVNTGSTSAVSVVAGGTSNVQLEVLAGDLAVGTITAAGDVVDLKADGGAITDANGGTANIAAATLMLSARDAIATSGDPLDTAVGTLSASTSGTMVASSINMRNTGSLNATAMTAGGAGSNVMLEVLAGDLTVGTVTAAGDLVDLKANGGTILDGNAGAANVAAGTLTLSARDAIAAVGDPLETAVTQVSATTLGTLVASPIHLENTGSVTAVLLDAGGAGSNVQLDVLGGNLAVGVVNAGGDAVVLNAAGGAITDANAGADNVTTGQLTLLARDGIGGAGNPLELLVNALTATTTLGNASTHVSDADGLASLTVNTNITAFGSGTVSLGGMHTLAIDANGVVTGSAVGTAITFTNSGASTGIAFGGLTAGSLTLSVTGAVSDGSATGTDLAAGAVSITSGGAVGTALDPIETAAASFVVNTTAGGVFVNESDGAALTTIAAGGAGSHVTVVSALGNLGVGSITAAGTVTLEATAGSLTDGDAGVDVTAASALLTAGGGIGGAVDPLEVLVSALTTTTTGSNASTYVTDADGLASITVTSNLAAYGSGTASVGVGGASALALDGNGVLTVNAPASAVSFRNTAPGVNLSIGAVAAANASMRAEGSLVDANGASPNVAGTTATFTAGGAVGTTGDPIETDVATVNATTVAGGVFLAEAGDVAVGSISAPGAVVELAASAGRITDDGEAGADITAASATLTARDGIGATGDPLDVLVGALTATTTGANASTHLIDSDGFTSLSITANLASYAMGTVAVGGAHTVGLTTGGVLSVNAAPVAFSFRNTAAAVDLSLGAVSAASAALRAEGSILDANGAGANVGGTSVTFTAGGSVGTLADPIDTDVASISAATANGGVFLNEDDGATLVSLVAGGLGANVQVVTSTGDLTLGVVDAAGDDVTLASSAGRIDDDGETAADVIARTASLSAPGGIGTALDAVEVAVDDVTLTADGLNASIFADDADGLNNLTISVNIGDFGAAGVQIGGADMLSTGPDGSLTLDAPGTIVTFNNVLTSADLVLGVVTGTDVMINSVGAIFDGNGDAPNVIAQSAIIQSIGAVGSPGDPIEIQVDELTASVVGGGLFVEDVDGLTLTNVVATGVGANVEVTALAGDITVGNVSAAGGVVLVANAGGIRDDGEGGTDVAAVSAVFVSRDGVGTTADPLDVAVSELGVLASGANARIAIADPDGFTGVALDVNLSDFAAGGIAISGPGNLATTATGHLGGTLSGTDLALTNRAAGASFLLDSLTVRDATVVTEGSILDGNGGVMNLVGRNVSIDIAGMVGTGLDALETSIDRIDAFTGDGGVHLSEASGLKIGVVDAGGAGRDVTIAVAGGTVELGRAIALDDRVAISANGGSLLDDELDVPDLVGRRVDLFASGSIGTGLDGIETDADQLTAIAMGGSAVIREADGVELVEVRATDDVIVVTEAGGIALGLVSARDDVLLRTPGSILDANSDALNIEGDVATLEAGGSIGTAADRLETRLTELDATTEAGEVAFDEADGINLRDVVVGGGFELDAKAGGDIGLGSVIVDAGVTIDAGGSIVATAPGNNLISTGGTVTLDAGGVIGTSDAPIDAQVAGPVAVEIGSAAPDGRSSAFTAAVSAEQLVKKNTPPGSVETGGLDVDFQQIDADVSMTQPQTVFRSFAALSLIAVSAPPPASLVPGVVILDGGTRGLDGSVTPSSQPFTLALGNRGERSDPVSSSGLSGPSGPATPPAGDGKAKTAKSLGEYRAASR